MNIDHIAIWTNDLEKLKNFYLHYFKCKCSEKYVNPHKQFSSYFLSFSEGMRIELMKRPEIVDKSNTEILGLAHLAINVGTRDKVEQLTKMLEEDGFTIYSYPRITGDGYYESVVLDPENNKIELTAIEDYRITEANTGDLEQILYLQKCCYLSEAEIYNDYSIPPVTQTLNQIHKDFENQTILKLEFKNTIIGSVRAYLKNDTCFIGRLIVDAHYQNRGFGRLLLEAIEKKFDIAARFELFTGAKSDKNLHLYKKLGYKEYRNEIMNGIPIVFLQKQSNR